ncbi:MAG: acetolactate synthase small subunit [Desulfocapsaceae bacterium]
MEEQFYVLTMLVANKPGVTSRVTGLFSGRGYNMESICGAPTHDPEISRITIKTKATPDQYIEIQKQLERLIDVIKLRDMTIEKKAVRREMALISVAVTSDNRAELLQVVEIFNGKVVNAGSDSYIVEVTGNEGKINAMIDLLRPLGIKKLTRSGILALYRELDESHWTD